MPLRRPKTNTWRDEVPVYVIGAVVFAAILMANPVLDHLGKDIGKSGQAAPQSVLAH